MKCDSIIPLRAVDFFTQSNVDQSLMIRWSDDWEWLADIINSHLIGNNYDLPEPDKPGAFYYGDKQYRIDRKPEKILRVFYRHGGSVSTEVAADEMGVSEENCGAIHAVAWYCTY